MSVHFHPLRVAGVERDAESLLVRFSKADFTADLADVFGCQAGQYLTLRADIDGQDLRRNYSICSAPDDADLQVSIRHVPGGRFSGWAMQTLRPGALLHVLPPDGRFVFRPDPRAHRHVVCFAAGSGITPMMSILKTVLRNEPLSHATLIYGNRTLASTMFREELSDLKNRHLGRFALHHVFSREAQEVELFNGRLDRPRLAQILQTLVPADGIDQAYLCGPAGMIEAGCAALDRAGVDQRRIHVERFGDGLASSHARIHPPASGDAEQAQISLIIDGSTRTIEFGRDDASILDAGLRGGLELPYACRAGVCSTCRGRVLDGQVRMDRNFALSADELAQGFVLCCQAHPLSQRVRITLDQR